MQIVSIVGTLIMLGIAYLLSSNRKRVDLKAVLWGVGLQWAFAALLLWVPWGKVALEAVANFVTSVLNHSYAGSSFVFGALGLEGGGDSGGCLRFRSSRRSCSSPRCSPCSITSASCN